MTPDADLCIWHGNCQDGFGAALAVKLRFPTVALHPAVYGDPPPDVTGKHVVVVDFSYPLETLQKMAAVAKSVLVIDHHKTAQHDLAMLPHAGLDETDPWREFQREIGGYCRRAGLPHLAAHFNLNRSGARLAWEFFHATKQVPRMIQHIEDRDLWRFAMEGTREYAANLFSHPYDFEVWMELLRETQEPLTYRAMLAQGAAIERKHHKDIAELLLVTSRPMIIGGHRVLAANMPYTMASDAAGKLAEGLPFGATYYDTATRRVFSLRSRGDFDVSQVAKSYGGGGHKNAAGFSRALGWEGDHDVVEAAE